MFAEEQWEKELDNELQEFELVDNGASNNDNQSDDWEKDADGLLDDDEDLKWIIPKCSAFSLREDCFYKKQIQNYNLL